MLLDDGPARREPGHAIPDVMHDPLQPEACLLAQLPERGLLERLSLRACAARRNSVVPELWTLGADGVVGVVAEEKQLLTAVPDQDAGHLARHPRQSPTCSAELSSTSFFIVLKFLEVEVTSSCLSKKLFVNLESLCFVL